MNNTKMDYSRPAFGQPRPKVTIMAQGYTLQNIWGPISHQKVCCGLFHPRHDLAENFGTIFPPKSMLP